MNQTINFPFNLHKGDRDEVRDLFARNDNTYTVWLHEQLTKGSKDVRAFAEYGLSHVTLEANLKLSDFFFVLSAISEFPEEVQDFFTDVMVFCEAEHVKFKSVEEVRTRYENAIAALLVA